MSNSILDNPNYKIRNIILNLSSPLTIKNIYKATNKNQITNKGFILNTIRDLCQYGLLVSSENGFKNNMEATL